MSLPPLVDAWSTRLPFQHHDNARISFPRIRPHPADVARPSVVVQSNDLDPSSDLTRNAVYGTIGDRRKDARLPSQPTSSPIMESDPDTADELANTDRLVRSLCMSPDLEKSFALVHSRLHSSSSNSGSRSSNSSHRNSSQSAPNRSSSSPEPTPVATHSMISSSSSTATKTVLPNIDTNVPSTFAATIDSGIPTPILDHSHSPSSFIGGDAGALRTPRDELESYNLAFTSAEAYNFARRSSYDGGLGLVLPDTAGSSDLPQSSDNMPYAAQIRSDPCLQALQTEIERLQLFQQQIVQQQHQLQQRTQQQQFHQRQQLRYALPSSSAAASQYSFSNANNASSIPPSTSDVPFPSSAPGRRPSHEHALSLPQQQQLRPSPLGPRHQTQLPPFALASSIHERIFTNPLAPPTPFQHHRFASFPSGLPPKAPPMLAQIVSSNQHQHQQQLLPAITITSGPSSSSPSTFQQHSQQQDSRPRSLEPSSSEPLNFMSLLQPSSDPPYRQLVHRIVRQADQQASIFIQQKLKSCSTNSPQDLQERSRILDAILGNAMEMMTNRFGNWAFQRCLEDPCTHDERRRVANALRGHVVEMATNCYGTHVVQKALACEEDIRLLVLSELLLDDPAATLINKHASHVWSRIMELSWSPPAPPIFEYVNKALRGRWVELATHETGSLVVQHLFENCEQDDTRDCLGEIFDGFHTVVRDQWGSFVIQHMLEHGLAEHRTQALNMLGTSLALYATDTQAMKSIDKALKVCATEAVEVFVGKMCEPGKSGRRPLLVDLALNANGNQLVCQILPLANLDQRKRLAAAIKKHVVTLKGNKAGSKIVWMFERMRVFDGY